MIRVDEVGPGGKSVTVAATDGERRALVRRLGILDLAVFEGEARIRAFSGGDVIRIEGTFRAHLSQACVVSLVPVPETVSGTFTVVLRRHEDGHAAPKTGSNRGEIDLDDSSDDDEETLTGDTVDLGEILTQHVALSMAAYPRAPGADAISLPADGDAPEGARGSRPFSGLSKVLAEKPRGRG